MQSPKTLKLDHSGLIKPKPFIRCSKHKKTALGGLFFDLSQFKTVLLDTLNSVAQSSIDNLAHCRRVLKQESLYKLCIMRSFIMALIYVTT